MNYKTIALVVGIIIVAASVTFMVAGKKGGSSASAELARVGSIAITEKDVDYRLGVERAYGDDSLTPDDALHLLIREATEQEVAKAFGVLPTQADISSFEAHADSATKAPEILQTIKNVFGADTASYDRIYILPKVVNVALHSFFSENKDINKEQFARIQKAYAEVTAGGMFEEVARNDSLLYATSTQSVVPQGIPPAMQKYLTAENMPKSRILTAVEALKPGQIGKAIVEDDYAYSIVRLLSEEKGLYKIESIVSQKRDYDAWYKDEAQKIPVTLGAQNI